MELQDAFYQLCTKEEYEKTKTAIAKDVVGAAYCNHIDKLVLLFYDKKWFKCWEHCDMLIDITWEKLNTGYWKDIDISWRHAYTFISVSKAFCEFHLSRIKGDKIFRFEDIAKTCDMGLLMGAPLLNNILSRMIEYFKTDLLKSGCKRSYDTDSGDADNENSSSKKKSCDISSSVTQPILDVSFNRSVARVSLPSIERFRSSFMEQGLPVIIEDSMSHWPAMRERKWSLDYIKHVAGFRTVPIEIGSKYTDEDWSQKLMLLSHFIDNYIADENVKPGYLAQHQLFEQIPELERDISIPTYCCLSEIDDVDINAWFGPKGTVSPLHYDPKHNFLCQVVGYKYIKLYSIEDTSFLYPHEGKMLSNTSQVDVENPDLVKFPDFVKATAIECYLRPGDMLYIPPKFWHYVRSLSVSFSVSYWW